MGMGMHGGMPEDQNGYSDPNNLVKHTTGEIFVRVVSPSVARAVCTAGFIAQRLYKRRALVLISNSAPRAKWKRHRARG